MLFTIHGFSQNEIDENFNGFPSNTSYTDFTHEGWELTKVISSPNAASYGTGSNGLLQFRSHVYPIDARVNSG